MSKNESPELGKNARRGRGRARRPRRRRAANPSNFFDILDLKPDTRIIRSLLEMDCLSRKKGGYLHGALRTKTGDLRGAVQREEQERPLRLFEAAHIVEHDEDNGDNDDSRKTKTGKNKTPFRLTDEFVIAMAQTPLGYKASEIKSPIPLRQGDRKYEFEVSVPGAALICGEHSVILGEPAIVMPLPIFVTAGLDLTLDRDWKDEIQGDTLFGFADPNDEYSFLKSPTPLPPARCKDAQVRELVNDLQKTFNEKLRNTQLLLGKTPIRKASLVIASDIPPRCGLGSSGALSAALAILLDMYKHDSCPEVGKWHDAEAWPLKSLNNPAERFFEIFHNAYELERRFHEGRSSGVDPFASLVGSPDGTPFLYQRSERNDNDDNDASNLRIRTYKRLTPDQVLPWKEQVAAACVFTQHPRIPSANILRGEAYWKALKACGNELGEISSQVWEDIINRRWFRLVSDINLYAGCETFNLGIMRSQDEEKVRQLCGHFRAANLGVKYTGAGNGGDIISVGEKHSLQRSLIPGYFPVHFASFASVTTPLPRARMGSGKAQPRKYTGHTSLEKTSFPVGTMTSQINA